jgi:hypothetical protein
MVEEQAIVSQTELTHNRKCSRERSRRRAKPSRNNERAAQAFATLGYLSCPLNSGEAHWHRGGNEC